MRKQKLFAGVGLAVSLAAGITLVAAWWHKGAPNGAMESEEGFDSPRLAVLANELGKGDARALDQFWDELKGNAPLTEPAADDPRSSWVTFIWRGDSTVRRMNVQGGPATGDFAAKMSRLGKTDLWYRTDRVPNDARFTYYFQVNRPLKFPPHSEKLPPIAPPHADPFNPKKKLAGPERSLAELPDAPAEPWLTRLPDAAKGSVKEHKIRSELLAGAWKGVEQERRFAVYTPPKYEPTGEPCGMLVMFDGGGYSGPDLPAPVILDRLICENKIAPMMVVFVFQTAERNREVGCSEPFADFVSKELTPWVRKNYSVSADPKRVIACGMSGGGLMAAYCGFRHSEVFGNVLSLSGGFGFWQSSLEERMDEEPGWLTRQFVKRDRLPVRFYLAVGRFENWFFPYNMLVENRRFRDVLEAKGYSVQYREFSGGHDPVCWRGPFVEGLMALAPKR